MADAASTLVMTPRATGGHNMGNCEGRESLYVIHLYTRIAKRRAENCYSIVARFSSGREERLAIKESSQLSEDEMK
jgi:hypothetical protein